MMNVDKIGDGEKYYDLPIEAQGEINQVIPFEIFERILSNLNEMDIQRANLVGRLWSLGAIDTAKQKEFSFIKGFAKCLCDKLPNDSYADQKKALLNICTDTKVLDSVNLIEIKYSIYEMKETLLIIVKDLMDDDLNDLEVKSQNERKPLFFENFFELAKIYKQIDAANKMPFMQRESALQVVVKALIENNHIDKALEVANQLTDEGNKDFALQLIGCKLSENGNPDRGLIVAGAISNDLNKDNTLLEVVKAFIQKNDLDKASEVFKTIVGESHKNEVIHELIEPLLKGGHTETVLELINTLIGKDKQDPCLTLTSVLLIEMGNLIGAIEIGNMILDKDLQSMAFEEIDLIKEGGFNIDDAIKVAESNTDEFEQGLAFRDISRVLARIGEIEIALGIANRISDESIRLKALKDINGFKHKS